MPDAGLSIGRGRRSCVRPRHMFERRLFFHVDWALLTAILLLAGIGIAMIYSTTYVTLPSGDGHAGRAGSDAGVCARDRSGGADRLHGDRLPHPRRAFALPLRRLWRGCSSSSCSRVRRSSARSAGSISARSTCSLRSSRGWCWRSCSACTSAKAGAARAIPSDLMIGGLFMLVPLAADRQAARPRHRRHAAAGFPGRRLPGRHAHAAAGGDRAGRRAHRADRLEVRARAVSAIASPDVHRSEPGPARRRLPDDPGAHHRRLRGPDRQGLPRRDAGAIQVPPRRAQ